jgi:hypothetical protein
MDPIPRLEVVVSHFIRAKVDPAWEDRIPRNRHWNRENDHSDDGLEKEFSGIAHGLDILGQHCY